MPLNNNTNNYEKYIKTKIEQNHWLSFDCKDDSPFNKAVIYIHETNTDSQTDAILIKAERKREHLILTI